MRKIVFGLILILSCALQAQTVMTLGNAIDTALLNNLDIQIARNMADIARISDHYGMAGGLPVIGLNANDKLKYQNSASELSDGSRTTADGVLGNDLNAELSAGIVLFNGFRVMATKKRLAALREQSEMEMNAQIQNVVAAVMIQYYEIVRQQSYVQIMQSVYDLSLKKLEIVNERKNVGLADGADVMQATSDLNTTSQNLETQQMIVKQEKAKLMLLLNSGSSPDFVINDSIVPDPTLIWDSIVAGLKRNPDLLAAEQEVIINRMSARETAASQYPSLRFDASYGLYRSDMNGGSIVMSQVYGPSAGISLNVPIFNGNIYRTQKKIADIRVDNALLQQQSRENRLHTMAYATNISYANALKQIGSQKSNLVLAQQLIDLVLEQFRYGNATILDLKAAQNSYETTAYQLVNYRYTAKLAEIELKQLIFRLSY